MFYNNNFQILKQIHHRPIIFKLQKVIMKFIYKINLKNYSLTIGFLISVFDNGPEKIKTTYDIR